MLSRAVLGAAGRRLSPLSSVRPTIQKRFFGDPHADTGAEAATALVMWKNVTIAVAVPSVLAAIYFLFIEEHEHELDLPVMPYKQVLVKKFPWGDGTKSFFSMMYPKHHDEEHDH